jgi:hypothetical protein
MEHEVRLLLPYITLQNRMLWNDVSPFLVWRFLPKIEMT